MKFSIFAVSALPLLASALPQGASPTEPCTDVTITVTGTASTATASPAPPDPGTFGVMALRSASPIHFLPMNAGGGIFYLGNQTQSYCPSEVVPDCPPGNITVFSGLGAMYDAVPGGQYTYITSAGVVGFSQAHSAEFPVGAITSPFTWSKDPSLSCGYLSTTAFGANGFMACPTSAGLWQVFANMQNATVPNGDVASCLGFDAATTTYNGPVPAWQYE